MKKNNNILFAVLFGLLMAFLFSFMIQEHFKVFKTKDLNGYFLEPEKPVFKWEWYKSGFFQKKTEQYIANKFGFREGIIRFYHQYCWDFYSKVFVSYIHAGKQKWLYYDHNVEDYYGTEMYHWYPSAEAAKKGYEQEVRLLNKVRGVLQDYDVTLMTFIAPSKDIIYPEFLPRREKDTASLDARRYFMKRFAETGMPCMDVNDYFFCLKDTCSFYLFPPIGDHWNFSCVYATDTLIRFMERLRDIRMPHLKYGDAYHSECCIGEDQNRDLESELNLIRPIRFDRKFDYKERDYWLTSDSATSKPAALFIGNSFLLRTIAYVPPQEVFSDFQFWYYNKVAYQGYDKLIDSVSFLNRLDYLLDADYIVWFSSASQMYRATEGFAEDAIIQLCIGEERFAERQKELIDSLFHDNDVRNRIAWNCSDSLYLDKLHAYTLNLMKKDPESYFPEISGAGVPSARNPKLKSDSYFEKRNIRKKIKADPEWMLSITNNMVINGWTLQQTIDAEVDNVLQGKPLMRDDHITKENYKEILITKMEQAIRNDREWLESLKKEAAEKDIPLDDFIHDNAVFMVEKNIAEGKVTWPE